MTTDDDIPAMLDAGPSNTPDNPPRKRSKVSRACDACRRKKIRCNAEYLATLQKVTKICTNCSKNNDACAFLRIPLKRGPSKGYIRDLEDKLDRTKPNNNTQSHQSHQSHQNHPNHQNNDRMAQAPVQAPTAPAPVPGPPQYGWGPHLVHAHHQPLPFPHKHLKGSPAIILPPLGDLQPKILPPKLASTSSTPSSPRSNSINGLLNLADTTNPSIKNSSPPIQGPFWKVPYEMPAGPSRRSSLTVLNGAASAASSASTALSSRRRSSVESISSTSTTGSRLASLKPSDSVVSDSDADDFYSVRSSTLSTLSIPALSRSSSANHHRRQSSTASPRNSVSSLSSLSGRINKTLHLQPSSPAPSPQYALPYAHTPQYALPYALAATTTTPQYQLPPAAPYAPSYRTNLALYYAHFHPAFPLLPLDQPAMFSLMDAAASEPPSPASPIVDLFNHTLHNLVHFNKVTVADLLAVLLKIVALYPFSHTNIAPSETHLTLFFSSLALLNYTMLLNGDIYTVGLAVAVAIFNDFKVLETFLRHVQGKEGKNHHEPKNYDYIALYLPKLYYVLTIIDDLYSLSFGVQKVINNNALVQFLKANVDAFVPPPSSSYNLKTGLIIFKQSQNFVHLVHIRDNFLLNSGQVSIDDHGFNDSSPTEDEFADHFSHVIKEKYDLVRCLLEINQFISNVSTRNDLDDLFENLMDYNLKLIRLMKKLSAIIVNFANYISTSTPSDSSPGHSSLTSPNKSHNNSTTSINEIASNATKLPESPAYNSSGPYPGGIIINPLLNITIGQLFKLIKLNKLLIDLLISLLKAQNKGHPDLLNRCVKINNDLSISYNLLNLNLVNLQIGSGAINAIRAKIGGYMLNFNIQGLLNSKSEDGLPELLSNWGNNFRGQIIPFIEGESIDGWL
ncbi:uncharacterized protein CANTADRAFT_21747 [Suhomyces tanzawaensis NRRL Y-17324]|uniref:Zn(2)-C6 fungal-type domain-containing protein n=1 Tax=Suhomyces tanzawaensis NRRL Y-17324 TaxID=984487 RepID=A0A1E4SHK7_9ASCO|nr:uncharacterized protein CANTADRAFT_21747 [Suhomyces tanzawaensis NRRL Y-17324]ODV78965.1 hypothetical protein CANTADRAFT_21747 [Suhomyces tanzawaensis NRRL Y-17324]